MKIYNYYNTGTGLADRFIRPILLVAACVCCIFHTIEPLHAAEERKTVSGIVVDKNDEPIIGANVFALNTTIGIATDIEGRFAMQVPGSIDRLVVSYVGMTSVEVAAGEDLRIVLQPHSELEEVVVVGYGAQKKASISGAISAVTNKDIVTTKSPSLAVALAGKVPGLNIRQTNGMPGSFSTDVNVRGMGTPLIIIDGVVRHDMTEFQKLVPEDVESITVLKDASAAIYGINSSNGAILVTTKSGTKGPLKVSLNMLFGVSSPTRHTEMMNGRQYWEIRNEDGVNSGGTPYFGSREALEKAQALPSVDWYDETFKKATFQQQYSLTVEGGTDKISTYTSIGYQTDNGLLRSNDIGYEKYSFRTGTQFAPHRDLKINLSLSGYSDMRKQPGTWDDAFSYINRAAHGIIPTESIYANNNPLYFNRPEALGENSVQYADRDQVGYREWRDKLFSSNLSIVYSAPFLQGLEIKLSGAYDAKSSDEVAVQKNIRSYRYSAENDEYISIPDKFVPNIRNDKTLVYRLNTQASIGYKRLFAEAHNLNILGVFEVRQDKDSYLGGQRFYDGEFFPSDNIDQAPEASQKTYGHTGLFRYVSFIGRLNYDYRGKYLVEFAFREDGSYRYAPNQRWGFFPVVSGAWRISEEPFVRDNAPWITNLKIRGSWGRTGQDEGNAFQYVAGYDRYNGYVLDPSGRYTNGYRSTGLTNPYLSWTTSDTSDLGIDISLWGGKLDLTADIYRRDRKGLLADRYGSLPNIFGAKLPQENLNSERTEGFELMIGHRNTEGEFTYGVTANVSFNRTKNLHVERGPYSCSMDRWRNGSDNRWQGIGWGYLVSGQYQDFEQIRNGVIEGYHDGQANATRLPGDYIHVDVNNDGMIDQNDMLPLFWTGAPKVNYGLTIYGAWKGLDFSMLWQGAGKYTVKHDAILGRVLDQHYSNSPAMFYDRWHLKDAFDPESEWIAGKYPATRSDNAFQGSNNYESSRQRINGTYLRLKNIEVGYTIGSLTKAGISKLRCYVNLTNPLIFCHRDLKSFDPEASDGAGFQYPLTRMCNLGINVTF